MQPEDLLSSLAQILGVNLWFYDKSEYHMISFKNQHHLCRQNCIKIREYKTNEENPEVPEITNLGMIYLFHLYILLTCN